MATPQINLRFLDHSGPDWIQMNVASQFQKINVCVNQDRLVTSLKKVTRPTLTPVEPPGITKTEILKDSGKGNLPHLNREVDMIAHQAEGVDTMPIPLYPLLEQEIEASPISVIGEECLPALPRRMT